MYCNRIGMSRKWVPNNIRCEANSIIFLFPQNGNNRLRIKWYIANHNTTRTVRINLETIDILKHINMSDPSLVLFAGTDILIFFPLKSCCLIFYRKWPYIVYCHRCRVRSSVHTYFCRYNHSIKKVCKANKKWK